MMEEVSLELIKTDEFLGKELFLVYVMIHAEEIHLDMVRK